MSTAGTGWACALISVIQSFHVGLGSVQQVLFCFCTQPKGSMSLLGPQKPNPRCFSAIARFAAVSNQRHCICNSDSSAPFFPNLKEKQIDNEILLLLCFCDV